MYQIQKDDKKARISKNQKNAKQNQQRNTPLRNTLPFSNTVSKSKSKSKPSRFEGSARNAAKSQVIKRSLEIAGKSTASLGKYDPKIKGAPKLKKR
mgnify:CR=1 FL=1